MTTAHTATPWRLLNQEPVAQYLRIRGTKLGGKFKIANVPLPTWTEPSNFDVDESVANAEFIVRACNAHNDLVSLVGDLIRDLPHSHPLKDRALDVLAKVGGA